MRKFMRQNIPNLIRDAISGPRGLRHAVKVAVDNSGLTQTTVQLTVSPVLGATTYVLMCPEALPTPFMEQALKLKAARDHGIELLELTSPALTSGSRPQNAFSRVAAAAAADQPAPAS